MIERQQRMLAEGDDDHLFLDAQYFRMHVSLTGGQVFDGRAFLPLRRGLLVAHVAIGENAQALLTILLRSIDQRCRASGPMNYLAQ